MERKGSRKWGYYGYNIITALATTLMASAYRDKILQIKKNSGFKIAKNDNDNDIVMDSNSEDAKLVNTNDVNDDEIDCDPDHESLLGIGYSYT